MPPDRRLAGQLAYGTVKYRKALDWVVDPFLERGMAGTPPWPRAILRLAAFQLGYLDRIPAWAVGSTSVELAKKYAPAQARLVNAVVRQLVQQPPRPYPDLQVHPVEHLAVKFSHPEWLVEKWVARLGIEETIKLCTVNNETPPLILRVNTLKTSRPALLRMLEERGITAEPGSLAPEAVRVSGITGLGDQVFFTTGLALAQDEASMLVARVLDPVAGSLVIDACAGPGTKTAHLAQLMRNVGNIIAVDIHAPRVRLIEENCRRLGVTNTQASVLDARRLPEKWPQKADFILVDAPCSGTGALRRRPDLRWRQGTAQLRELQRLQKELLAAAVAALKPGGVLVYSTCSVLTEENEEIAGWLEAAYPHMRPAGLRERLPEALQPVASGERIQLWPQRHGTDGFFIARWVKQE